MKRRREHPYQAGKYFTSISSWHLPKSGVLEKD
jgi:hypothetical protein